SCSFRSRSGFMKVSRPARFVGAALCFAALVVAGSLACNPSDGGEQDAGEASSEADAADERDVASTQAEGGAGARSGTTPRDAATSAASDLATDARSA